MKLATILFALIVLGLAVFPKQESYCEKCRKKPTWDCIQVCDLGLNR